MKKTIYKRNLILIGLLLSSLLIRANETESGSGDTIPSRYRNYYYTHWYDECTGYQNGGRLDSCYYYWYRTIEHPGRTLKREYTSQPLKIKGLVAMIMTTSNRYNHTLYPYPETQYLYLMKKMDTVDTVRPSSPTHFYRMKILDSVRFDTVTPRYMEMTQGSDDIPLDYCYVYEAYFDKPIVVDSDFYLYGTTNITRVTEGGQDYPMYKVLEYAQVITLVRKRSSAECQDVSESDPDGMPNICPTEGHWNTMTYYGYADFSIYGYPITGQPWAMNDYIFPNDPFGFYLAIVENYKLEVNTEDSTKGVGVGGGIYYNSDGTEIQAVPNAGYRFIHWNDGSTENPRTVYLTQDTVFTAYFDTATYYNVETAVNHEYWGVVTGGGAYAVNTEVELEAVPAGGFMFEQWGDGDTQNPRTVTVTQDTLFTAVFSLDTTPTGIPEAGRLAFGIAPNPTGGRLTVTLNESSPCEAEVYDATGRCVLRATLQGPQSDLDVRRLPAGRHTLRLTCGNKTGVRTFVKN